MNFRFFTKLYRATSKLKFLFAVSLTLSKVTQKYNDDPMGRLNLYSRQMIRLDELGRKKDIAPVLIRLYVNALHADALLMQRSSFAFYFFIS